MRTTQIANRGADVGGILKQSNGGEAGGAGAQTFCGILDGDAADGDDWNFHRAANFVEAGDALRRAVLQFRWRGKDWAEENVICAVVRRGGRGFKRMR
jgi:hypothetical protein